MTDVVVANGASTTVIALCEERIAHFIEADAYADYDYAGTHLPGDRLTRDHLRLINDVMRARSPIEPWFPFLDKPFPDLSHIPPNLDLIDADDAAVEQGLAALARIVEPLANTRGLTDMAASKMLFLLRPLFVPISDSYVRALLGVSEPPAGSQRLVSLARRLREVASTNREPLEALSDFVGRLQRLVPKTGRFKGQEVPVSLSKARILDIVLWTEVAIGSSTPNLAWRDWWTSVTGELPASHSTAVPPPALSVRRPSIVGGGGVIVFHNDEGGYASFLQAGVGFVANGVDNASPAEWRVVHRSDCRMLNNSAYGPGVLRTSIGKACAHDLASLLRFMEAHFGREGSDYRRCAFCFKKPQDTPLH